MPTKNRNDLLENISDSATVKDQFLSGLIADGTGTKTLDSNSFMHVISIMFYSDAGLSVVVDKANMTGDVIFEMSETGEEFATMTNGTLALGTTQYSRAEGVGSYKEARVTFDTVAGGGATHYRMLVASSAS